jgi:drug/metabolite transporter (DMT)-like permease
MKTLHTPAEFRQSGTPELSAYFVNTEGQLTLRGPGWRAITKQAMRDMPLLGWLMLVGMTLVLSLAVWGITHPEIAVTHSGEKLAYIFLILVSGTAVAGILAVAYYLSRVKLVKKYLYEANN